LHVDFTTLSDKCDVIELRRSGNLLGFHYRAKCVNGRLPARTERVRSGGKPFRYSLPVYTEFIKNP